jgi:hypothetical protein
MKLQATGALSLAYTSRREVSNNLLYGFKAARIRSPRAPRLTAGDAAHVSAPLRPRLRRSRATSEPHDRAQTRPVVAGAVGSAALPTYPVRDPRRARSGGHSDTLRSGPKTCPSCRRAYGPLPMPDPSPGRPPTKPAPLT